MTHCNMWNTSAGTLSGGDYRRESRLPQTHLILQEEEDDQRAEAWLGLVSSRGEWDYAGRGPVMAGVLWMLHLLGWLGQTCPRLVGKWLWLFLRLFVKLLVILGLFSLALVGLLFTVWAYNNPRDNPR